MALSNRDEAKTLRSRHADLAVVSDTGDDESDTGVPACLVRTQAVGTYPTATGKYFMCVQVIPAGAEIEGGTVNLSTIGQPFAVAILGSAVPPNGTYLIARQINSRWNSRYL